MCNNSSESGPSVCKKYIPPQHLMNIFYNFFIRLILGIIIFYVSVWISREVYKFLWRVTVFWNLRNLPQVLKYWSMALYTIYESGGEIFELNDAGDSGGNIGVSNDY